MTAVGDYLIPLLVGAVLLFGLCRGVDVFGSFVEGAAEGLRSAVSIVPALVCLLTAVSMFRGSGALDVFVWAIAPITRLLGMPDEVLPLALMRPISGSGATALFDGILRQYGADSTAGRVASVLMGSTETTFYTIAVYYGATKVKNTRHTLTASLAGDITGMVMSVLTVFWLL